MEIVREFWKDLKNAFKIKENTPSFIVSGLMGCVVSAILIVIRIIQVYFF